MHEGGFPLLVVGDRHFKKLVTKAVFNDIVNAVVISFMRVSGLSELFGVVLVGINRPVRATKKSISIKWLQQPFKKE